MADTATRSAPRRLYDPGDFYDEALDADGRPRPEYEAVLAHLAEDPAGAERAVRRRAHQLGVSFGEGDAGHEFRVDPVPRVIAPREWRELTAGLAQRARALNAFVVDVYAERRAIAAEIVPGELVEGCRHLEPSLVGAELGQQPATIAGFDLIRCPDGRFRVLEDNVRTPSGIAYAMAARRACDPVLEGTIDPRRLEFESFFDALGGALRDAAPDPSADPTVVLLSDGPQNYAWYEHRLIADAIGVPVVTREELRERDGRIWVDSDPATPVDVVLRRTDEDRLADESGHPTWLGELFGEPLRRGTVRVANGFGCGVADDKRAHAHVEAMIRFYLGEEPLLESVPSWDLLDRERRERAREHLGEIVVKPRGSYGGKGVVIGSQASEAELREARRRIEREPESLVVQEVVPLSRHPTVCGGRLQPRHVDLRAFAVSSPGRVEVAPGGLTRVALEPGSLLVNSTQGGGGKDTWALAEET